MLSGLPVIEQRMWTRCQKSHAAKIINKREFAESGGPTLISSDARSPWSRGGTPVRSKRFEVRNGGVDGRGGWQKKKCLGWLFPKLTVLHLPVLIPPSFVLSAHPA